MRALMAGDIGAVGGTLAPGYAVEQRAQDREHRQSREVAGGEAAKQPLQAHARGPGSPRPAPAPPPPWHTSTAAIPAMATPAMAPPAISPLAEEHARSRLHLGDGARAALEPPLDQPAHRAPDEHRGRGRDRQVDADRDRQRLQTHQLDREW